MHILSGSPLSPTRYDYAHDDGSNTNNTRVYAGQSWSNFGLFVCRLIFFLPFFSFSSSRSCRDDSIREPNTALPAENTPGTVLLWRTKINRKKRVLIPKVFAVEIRRELRARDDLSKTVYEHNARFHLQR